MPRQMWRGESPLLLRLNDPSEDGGLGISAFLFNLLPQCHPLKPTAPERHCLAHGRSPPDGSIWWTGWASVL